MQKLYLDWQVGLLERPDSEVNEWMPAKVPGSVQQDYALAHRWEDPYCAANVDAYKALEDVYWPYRAPLRFELKDNERATMVFWRHRLPLPHFCRR